MERRIGRERERHAQDGEKDREGETHKVERRTGREREVDNRDGKTRTD